MEILNAYDLTGSCRAAADLCGCSHHTVKKAVEDRDAGYRRRLGRPGWLTIGATFWRVGSPIRREKSAATKPMNELRSLGYTGTDRTTRRALAEIKSQWRLGNTRVHRPWITEPGLWLQYDFADGPVVAGRKIVLVGGVVGVVPVPGGHSAAGPDRAQRLRRPGPDLPHHRWRADLPA